MASYAVLVASYLLGALALVSAQSCTRTSDCPIGHNCVPYQWTCLEPIRPMNAGYGVLPSGYNYGSIHGHGTDGGYSRPFYGTPEQRRLYPFSPKPGQPGYSSAELSPRDYTQITGYNGYGYHGSYG